MADQGNDPTSLTTRRAYDLLADGFGPGFNGPILLAADLASKADVAPTDRAAVTAFAASLRSDPDVAFVAPVNVNQAGDAAVVAVTPKGAPQDQSTERLVEISIADSGCGIPAENLPRVLEPFFTTKPHGNGLGLSICRSVLWEVDGTLTIQSEPGTGTRVHVGVPQAVAPQHAPCS